MTIKNLKYIGFLTTIGIFSYNSYNIEYISSKCILNGNIVWFYYLYCIIINGINIFIYLLAFLEYIRMKKINKINIINENTEYIEQNLVYDNDNNPLDNIYE
jgi:hypothetical protein